ncbi:MAG: MFS transporter [Proteobacteria bacterium]|nr:MFS transporter [Pseudomonadota bacterium]
MVKIFYGWWVVLACFLITLYRSGALEYGFTAFFEPIVEEFGWSYTQVSIAFSFRGLEMGILAPIMGFLVDRFGPSKLAFSGVLIIGFGLILLGLTNSLALFYSAFVLLALGTSGCASTVLMTAVAHWFRRNVGKAMGLVGCGFGAGGILIPLIVWLIDLHQWRTTLIILGLGMWAMGIPLSFVIRHRPEQYGYLPDGEIPGGPSSSRRGRDREERSFKEALKSGNLWKIGVAEVVRHMIAMAIITHIMPYLSSIGMLRATAVFVATSIPLFSIIGRFGFGWLSDIFDKRSVLVVLYCLFGLGILAFSYIHIKWLIFPFLLLFSLPYGGTSSLRGAIVREYFGRASFGRVFGLIMGMSSIGTVIGPAVAGWTFDNVGTYHPVWLWFTGATVISTVLMLRLKAPHQMSEEKEVA